MNKERYLDIVERIIASKSFGRSGTYANLLKYLLHCSLNKNIPKETTIASEVFGKESFDPSQSTLIRVYAYNLRKKITKYYENEGLNDIIKLKIPKGSYEVKFIEKAKPVKKKKTFTKPWALAIILSFLLITLLFNYSKKDNVAKTDLWSNLLSSKKNTMLVLGDLFIYNEIDSISGKSKTVRDPSINSKEEFELFKLNSTKKGIAFKPLSYAFYIRNSVNWVKDLGKVFYSSKKDFVIRNMSRFNPKELSDNNIIVVGMLKTFGLFKDYLNKENYTVTKGSIIYTDKNTGKKQIYKANGDADAYHTDYAIILKVPGPNNNSIYLFGGIWDTGASQSLKNFTNHKLAKQLENTMLEKFGKVPENYKILLEVSGIDRMELNSKILHIEEIIKH